MKPPGPSLIRTGDAARQPAGIVGPKGLRGTGPAGNGQECESECARGAPWPVPLALQQHYKPAEVARVWGLSEDTIVRLFRNEPGVLRLGSPGRGGKRKYVTLRIPASVLRRVHRRLRAAKIAPPGPLAAAPWISPDLCAVGRKRWRQKLALRLKRRSPAPQAGAIAGTQRTGQAEIQP